MRIGQRWPEAEMPKWQVIFDQALNDPDKIGSAKYHFIVAIESAIDMCNEVTATCLR